MWSPGEGVALWVGMDKRTDEILGCDPSFSGEGEMKLGLESFATDPPIYAGLEGGLSGWANASDESPDTGLCPVIIDLPAFDIERPRLRPGRVVRLQVSAFAHSLRCFDTDEAFFSAPGNTTPKGRRFSPEFFIPSGTFEQPNRAHAVFAGHVQRALVKTNPVSRLQFHHILVQTAAGLLDIVANPAVVQGRPVEAGVVSGEFWLSGRVVPSKLS